MVVLYLRNFFLAELPNGKLFPNENNSTSVGVQAGCFITWGWGEAVHQNLTVGGVLFPLKVLTTPSCCLCSCAFSSPARRAAPGTPALGLVLPVTSPRLPARCCSQCPSGNRWALWWESLCCGAASLPSWTQLGIASVSSRSPALPGRAEEASHLLSSPLPFF